MGFRDRMVAKTMRGGGGNRQQPPVMPPMPIAPISGARFDVSALKQKLKIGKTRAKVQQGKAQNQAFKTRQSVIEELRANKNPTACIRMEQYLRDTSVTESYDVLQAYIELLIARVPLIESTPVFDNLPGDCKEAVASVVFAASRISNVELRDAVSQLSAQYSPAVIDPIVACTGPNAHCINPMIASKLGGTTPDDYEILDGLKAIAMEENIDWLAPAEPDDLRKPARQVVGHHPTGVAYPNFSAANVPGASAPSDHFHPPPPAPPGYDDGGFGGGYGSMPPPPPAPP